MMKSKFWEPCTEMILLMEQSIGLIEVTFRTRNLCSQIILVVEEAKSKILYRVSLRIFRWKISKF